jgi:predicted RNA-binding Zn-ribbon protein involved in translation (DUF1610 family)
MSEDDSERCESCDEPTIGVTMGPDMEGWSCPHCGHYNSGNVRYIICENCQGHEAGWSVKVDEDGDVTSLECRDCGGSDWYRRSW